MPFPLDSNGYYYDAKCPNCGGIFATPDANGGGHRFPWHNRIGLSEQCPGSGKPVQAHMVARSKQLLPGDGDTAMSSPAARAVTMAVGFKVDGSGPYTLADMERDNADDPDLLRKLRAMKPGESFTAGGGAADAMKIEAVTMAIRMGAYGEPTQEGKDGKGRTVRVGDKVTDGVKAVGVIQEIYTMPYGGQPFYQARIKWDNGMVAVNSLDQFEKMSALSVPVTYTHWLSRLGWRDTAANRARFARVMAVKVGDRVRVTHGPDKGKTGTVSAVEPGGLALVPELKKSGMDPGYIHPDNLEIMSTSPRGAVAMGTFVVGNRVKWTPPPSALDDFGPKSGSLGEIVSVLGPNRWRVRLDDGHEIETVSQDIRVI